MKKLYAALKYVCIAALVISLIALVAVVAYVLWGGAGKLSADLLFGDYKDTAQSPQFYKQMAMASGLERIFETGL